MIAEAVRRFDLEDPAGRDLAEFGPGSHVRIRVPSGAIRKYSLCSSPAERHRYTIAVKRDAQGRGGSASLVDSARDGDLIEVGPPQNAFALVPAPRYVFVAGGIGITPIRAMILSLRACVPEPAWKLYFLTRSAESTAFRDEFLSPELRGRVTLHHDGGDPDRAFDLWPVFERPSNAHVYCCGPRALMDSVRDMTGHWMPGRVHFESFVDGAAPRPEDRAFTVALARSGRRVEVPVGTTLLAALRSAGCTVPSSCESGTCGSCRTALLGGEADHRDLVLMPEERARSIIVCVSRAHGGELVLDL